MIIDCKVYEEEPNLSVLRNRRKKKSPIYLFYEIVASGSDGTPGDNGDVHYHCLYGAHKICTIKKSMRSNLNGAFLFFFAAWFFS